MGFVKGQYLLCLYCPLTEYTYKSRVRACIDMATYINQDTGVTQVNNDGSVTSMSGTYTFPTGSEMNGTNIDNDIVIRNIKSSRTYKSCKELCDSLYATEPIWSSRLQSILDSAKYSPVTTNNTGIGERKNAAAIVDLYNKTIAAIDALLSEIQKHINSLPETQRKQQEAAGYNAALLGAPGSSSIEDTAARETSDLSAQSSVISEQGLQLGLGITSGLLQLANLGITTFGAVTTKQQTAQQIIQAGQVSLSAINEARKASGYEPLTSLDEVGSPATFASDANSPTYLRNRSTQKAGARKAEIEEGQTEAAYNDWKAINSGQNPWSNMPDGDNLYNQFRRINKDIGFYKLAEQYQGILNKWYASVNEESALQLRGEYMSEISAIDAAKADNASAITRQKQEAITQYLLDFEKTFNEYKVSVLHSWINDANNGSWIASAALMQAGGIFDTVGNPFEVVLGYLNKSTESLGNVTDTLLSFLPGGSIYKTIGKLFSSKK